MSRNTDSAAPSFPADVATVAFCLGAQKGGTTWLFEQLVRHPDIHGERPSDRPKELHYWNTVRSPFTEKFRAFASARRARTEGVRGLARVRELVDAEARARRLKAVRYEAMFYGDPYDHRRYIDYLTLTRDRQRVLFDSTPHYALLSTEVYAEMLALHADVRFLFVMRDPVKRLWSGVRHRHRGLLRRGTMGEASLLRAFEAALADPDHLDRRFSDYAGTVERLERAVPRERICYLFYEEMFEGEVFGGVCDFLGVSRIAAQRDEMVNEAEGPVFRAPPALLAEARRVLAPVYDALAVRFGPALPASWTKPPG